MTMHELIVKWNNLFPYDRIYREKYNIAFNSPEHRKVNQIDIYLDLYEDVLFSNYRKETKGKEERYRKYNEDGKLFDDSHITKEEQLAQELFDKVKFDDE